MSNRPTREEAEEAVRTLIAWTGDDPTRPGVLDTPKRVVKAWEEWCDGAGKTADAHLQVVFNDEELAEAQVSDQPVVYGPILFHSHCEHHMAPFFGHVWVGYLPNGNGVVGLSKLPRTVQVFAHRLQVQERLTVQIANAIDAALDPKGVAVIVRAKHTCACSRGVRDPLGVTTTSIMRGVFIEKPEARAEMMMLMNINGTPNV